MEIDIINVVTDPQSLILTSSNRLFCVQTPPNPLTNLTRRTILISHTQIRQTPTPSLHKTPLLWQRPHIPKILQRHRPTRVIQPRGVKKEQTAPPPPAILPLAHGTSLIVNTQLAAGRGVQTGDANERVGEANGEGPVVWGHADLDAAAVALADEVGGSALGGKSYGGGGGGVAGDGDGDCGVGELVVAVSVGYGVAVAGACVVFAVIVDVKCPGTNGCGEVGCAGEGRGEGGGAAGEGEDFVDAG